jgi:hypothetical protein
MGGTALFPSLEVLAHGAALPLALTSVDNSGAGNAHRSDRIVPVGSYNIMLRN